ncbi:MAG: UDP-N-acetylglucosamine 1-carboxyvinyltransferase [Clostridia bacterium]|nr:UDP-N-acetylglucosamine 1-carboxyvinyltransferase [Clostridia bacterium]
MEKLVITGGVPLEGTVDISGAKNSVLAILAGTLLVNGACRIENIPDISDVSVILSMIECFGAKIERPDNHTIIVDAENITYAVPDYELVRRIRGSYYLIGSLLSRFRKAEIAMPGGCNFGTRPIDQHIKGFTALGADIDDSRGVIKATAENLAGSSIYLDKVSVGATINIMLAACKADGVTVIENAAREPHIVDMANFLNSMGANIKGAGTNRVKIKGVSDMKGGTYQIIPDQIEAGTFMIAAAATGGNVLIKNVIPKHMESLTAKLIEAGAKVTELDDAIRVEGTGKLKATNVQTMPYPGFPTDLQPQMVALLTIAEGLSVMVEGVWDNRFQYTDELIRMGAKINAAGKMATIQSVPKLYGAPVKATDLRGGAAVVIAGLMAEGVTEVTNITLIDRGYEKFEEKLRSLGAKIERVEE